MLPIFLLISGSNYDKSVKNLNLNLSVVALRIFARILDAGYLLFILFAEFDKLFNG